MLKSVEFVMLERLEVGEIATFAPESMAWIWFIQASSDSR